MRRKSLICADWCIPGLKMAYLLHSSAGAAGHGRTDLNRLDIRLARAQWVGLNSKVTHNRFLFTDESGPKTNMTGLYARGPRGQGIRDSVLRTVSFRSRNHPAVPMHKLESPIYWLLQCY